MVKGDSSPLVTVAVVTYNSAKFVVETLESIKRQTYPEIELLISDDCSKDNTVELCQKWVDKNGSRFKRTSIITVSKNTGTAGNANRALNQAEGTWIKFFAGDDILTDDAIQSYVDFINQNVHACFAEYYSFIGDCTGNNLERHHIDIDRAAFGDTITAKQQYSILKKQFIGYGPTFFARVDMLKEIGGYDERFPLMDDHPLYLRIASTGHKLFLLHKAVCYYRIYENSVSHSADNNNAIISNSEIRCLQEYRYQYLYEHLNAIWRVFLSYSMWMKNLIIYAGNNKASLKCKIYRNIQLITDPFLWYSRFLNIWDKLLKLI